MNGKTEWPQALKDLANRVFSSCTDTNRGIVSEELKSIIFKAFEAGTINSTDWSKVQLKTLGGSGVASSSASASGSIGSSNGQQQTKKGKKRSSSGVTPAAGGSSDGFDDQDKREKRARRFERDQRAHDEEQERGWSDAISNTSLASRFGAAAIAESATNGSAAGGWVYDNTPSSAAAGPSRLGGRGWNSPAPASGGFDDSIADPNVIDWDRDTVVGLSTKLEKPYLRLTSAPDPKTVRPLPILQETLELLKKKWRSESNYAYICDQFKSMRQDLTVQRIKNDFTVKVYEIHARIALEKGDLGEYNQCQSQLRTLYAYGLGGSEMEFLAYRILYLLHTRNRREVNALMSELTPNSKLSPPVSHALSVRLALATTNYHAFFRLYLDAPNMNAYIMDHFIERERVAALGIMARAYRPTVPLRFIADELAFEGLEEADEFLRGNAVDVYVEPTPAEGVAAAAAVAAANGGSKKSKKTSKRPAIPLEERKWDCKNALPGVIAAGDKYRKVDIKGQI